MKTFVVFCFVIVGSLSQFAQRPAPADLKSFTLTSDFAEDGHGKIKLSDKTTRNCFDLVSEREVACDERWDLIYGNMRAGEDWDWFFVSNFSGVRTRIVSLGEKEWSDDLRVPYVEPFPRLAAGERRIVSVDASGADGAHGVRGGDQPRPTLPKPVTTSDHYVRVTEGTMYAVHVVDEQNDFYVLIRVDDVVRGRTATISWKRVPAPPKEWEKL